MVQEEPSGRDCLLASVRVGTADSHLAFDVQEKDARLHTSMPFINSRTKQ